MTSGSRTSMARRGDSSVMLRHEWGASGVGRASWAGSAVGGRLRGWAGSWWGGGQLAGPGWLLVWASNTLSLGGQQRQSGPLSPFSISHSSYWLF